MARSWLVPIILTALLAAAISFFVTRQKNHGKYKMPPRVPGIPFFGNTFQVPILQQGRWAREQAQKHGEMFTCTIGSNTWVFLNSSRVVNDLMEKRSAIYSSRPYFPMVSKLMSGDCRIVLMPYNDRWRSIRKIMHAILNKQNADTFAPYQDLESKHLLYDYLRSPDRWYESNQRFANSVIMSVVFGKRMELDDPNIQELFETSNEFLEAFQPGASIVDAFYFLERLPKSLQWWRGKGERSFKRTINVYKRAVARLTEQIEAGTARDCFALQFLQYPDSKKFGENQFFFALGSLMEAGSDTSRMTISQVTAAAAIDKRWVKTARAHIDKICGSNAERLPDFSDKANLPYITAVVKEGLRWRPFAEIGVPHMLTQDDEYEGYKFPAGTVFTWNAMNLALDPREHEDPERFWPERYLNDDLNNPLKGHWAFGPGRRVCPGYNVAESNVWIVVARLLYCFDFEQIPGDPIDSMNTNWLQHTHAPYPVKITVRSPQHAALVEREGNIAVATKY